MDKKELIERLQGKIESRPKRIDVSVGFKIVEEGKDTWYFAGSVGEGMCYKDIKAYECNSDICYIPECEFNGEGWGIEYRERLGYTAEEIEGIIEGELDWNYEDVPRCDDFTKYIARSVFDSIEGESIGVFLDRLDLNEEWNYYQRNFQNKFDIIK